MSLTSSRTAPTLYKYQRYIQDVQSGDVKTCETIKQAVRRHLDDLERAKSEAFPYYFDEEKGLKAVKFIQKLKHFEDIFKGKPVILEPWQTFIIVLLMGWRKKNSGFRRFRKVYLQVSRKNGKTIIGGGLILLFLLTGSSEEIYSIATKTAQAKIAYKKMRGMLMFVPALAKRFTILRNQISRGENTYQYMSSEDKMSDGFNPSFVLVDEYHAHPSDALVQVYQDGMGARSEPVMYIVTTAGYNKGSACYEEYERAKKVLAGIYEDDSLLAIIYELDRGDDWRDPENWIKANPNLNVSVSMDYMQAQFNEAVQKKSKESSFKTKNLNMWVSDSQDQWISESQWKRCSSRFDPEELSGRDCFAGIDLSGVGDLTGYTLTFPPVSPGETVKQIHRVYIPEDAVEQKEKQEHIAFKKWISQGYVTATPGAVTDHNRLTEDLKADALRYNIIEIGYDPYKSGNIISSLEAAGLEMVAVNQGMRFFSEPTKEWELAALKQIIQDFNPLMAWCVSNAVIKPDHHENYIPLKKDGKRKNKIDLVITSIIAYFRMTATLGARPKENPLNAWAAALEKNKGDESTINSEGERAPVKKLKKNPLNAWAEKQGM